MLFTIVDRMQVEQKEQVSKIQEHSTVAQISNPTKRSTSSRPAGDPISNKTGQLLLIEFTLGDFLCLFSLLIIPHLLGNTSF